jgi:hypothetical protein
VAWNALRAKPRPVHAFASEIPVFGPRGAWMMGRLPQEVHVAVGDELRRAGRTEAMREWFQTAWEGRSLQSDTPETRLEIVHRYLAEALRALHQTDTLAELEKQYRAELEGLRKAAEKG